MAQNNPKNEKGQENKNAHTNNAKQPQANEKKNEQKDKR